MLPLLQTKLEVGAAIALVAVGAIALKEHDNHVRAEAVATAVQQTQAQVQQQLQQQIKDIDAKAQADKAALQTQLASMQGIIAALKTPQQQVQWSQDQLATALKGITIQLDSKGQAVATIPAVTVPQLPQVIEQCKECSLKLESATNQLADAAKRENLLAQEATSKQQEVDALQKALKGGTWIQRTGKDLKVGAIGGAIAVAILCGLGHCK